MWIGTMILLVALAGGVAAAPFSGTWESTVTFSPSAAVFGDFVADLTAKLAVDYTLAGWVFGSETTFGLGGWGLQVYTAAGYLGGFTIDSTLQFDALIVASEAYSLASGESYQTQSVTSVTSAGASAVWSDSIWNCARLDKTITYGAPAFSSLQASAQISLFGVSFEGLFYLKGNDFEAKTVSGKWVYGDPYDSWSSIVTQTGSYTASACLPLYGSGWKFTLSGTAADMLITSYTYFNLEEYSYNELMTLAYAKTYIKDTFKLGGSYYLPKTSGETCDVTFNREFITVEGMDFGCADVDLGLNITCGGFDWVKVLLTDIELAPCLTLDALITFETQTKSITMEPLVTLEAGGCFAFKVLCDYTVTNGAFSIDGLKINGISMSYSWNGVSFSSATSFNPVLGPSGYYLAADVNSPTTYGFFIPDKNFSKDKFNTNTRDGYYTQVCYPEEYYDIWEMFTIETTGDGCCGGSYDFKVNTYFGDRKVLVADSFWFWYKDEDGKSFSYNTVGAVAAGASLVQAPTVSGSGVPYCEDNDVNYGVAYYDADEDTLFEWVKTDAEIIVPVSTAIELTFGVDVTTYGWEKLELGFEFTW